CARDVAGSGLDFR
nr:immunoglobulin heavy chain junction region [Macaca mulatta]